MAEETNYQRIKLIKLVELLYTESDEKHPMTTETIMDRLEAMHITCDRRTVTRDIDILNENGFEIFKVMVGHKRGYFVTDREFTTPELRILTDAVQAAHFITERKTEELIGKIASLGGVYHAEMMSERRIYESHRKHSNEAIYYTIDALDRAIPEGREVSFLYFDLDERKRKQYRHDKTRYVAKPVTLMCSEDNYYLLAVSNDRKGISTYRVDRMEDVQIVYGEVTKERMPSPGEIREFAEEAFHMYAGKTRSVTLRFDRTLLGPVYDRFGESIKIVKEKAGTLRTTVKVQVSPTFYGWMFQFAGRLAPVGPEDVVEEYRGIGRTAAAWDPQEEPQGSAQK